VPIVKKSEKSQINNLTMHLNLLKKLKQTKPKSSEWKKQKTGHKLTKERSN
jgi:hypothetical protein